MNLQKVVIKSKGLRITAARVAVLKVLEDSTKPLDISTISRLVKNYKVDADQATIYRIIESFYTADLVTKLHFGDNKFFYEAKRDEHHHAICNNCGKIEDILNCHIKRSDRRIYERIGFKVANHSLEFFGICRDCQN